MTGPYDSDTAAGPTPGGRMFGPGVEAEGEVDLCVYVTARVRITLAAPYTAAELADVAAHELGWQAEFVSVDAVELDGTPMARLVPEAPTRPAHGLFRRLRGV